MSTKNNDNSLFDTPIERRTVVASFLTLAAANLLSPSSALRNIVTPPMAHAETAKPNQLVVYYEPYVPAVRGGYPTYTLPVKDWRGAAISHPGHPATPVFIPKDAPSWNVNRTPCQGARYRAGLALGIPNFSGSFPFGAKFTGWANKWGGQSGQFAYNKVYLPDGQREFDTQIKQLGSFRYLYHGVGDLSINSDLCLVPIIHVEIVLDPNGGKWYHSNDPTIYYYNNDKNDPKRVIWIRPTATEYNDFAIMPKKLGYRCLGIFTSPTKGAGRQIWKTDTKTVHAKKGLTPFLYGSEPANIDFFRNQANTYSNSTTLNYFWTYDTSAWIHYGNFTAYPQWEPCSWVYQFNGNKATSGSMANQRWYWDNNHPSAPTTLTPNAFKREYLVNFDSQNGQPIFSKNISWYFSNWSTSAAGNLSDADKTDKKSIKNWIAESAIFQSLAVGSGASGWTLEWYDDAQNPVPLYAIWKPNFLSLPYPTGCANTGLFGSFTYNGKTYTERAFYGWYDAIENGNLVGLEGDQIGADTYQHIDNFKVNNINFAGYYVVHNSTLYARWNYKYVEVTYVMNGDKANARTIKVPTDMLYNPNNDTETINWAKNFAPNTSGIDTWYIDEAGTQRFDSKTYSSFKNFTPQKLTLYGWSLCDITFENAPSTDFLRENSRLNCFDTTRYGDTAGNKTLNEASGLNPTVVLSGVRYGTYMQYAAVGKTETVKCVKAANVQSSNVLLTSTEVYCYEDSQYNDLTAIQSHIYRVYPEGIGIWKYKDATGRYVQMNIRVTENRHAYKLWKDGTYDGIKSS